MKVTIKDIANIANVSIATVSKIVNHKDERISEATRQRVLKIIEEEGYVPNRIASSMVTRKTKTLGLIIPDITNPFFPELARGVEDASNDLGYTVILCNSDDNVSKEDLYIKMLQEKMVDGIILTAASRRSDIQAYSVNHNIPMICVDRKVEGLDEDGLIMVDNEIGAYDIISYLISQGYSKIYFISGPMNLEISKSRYNGYLRAHKEHGLKLMKNHIIEGNFDTQWGYDAVKEIISNGVEIDSIACGNDLIAFGVYKGLHELGISVPDDLGVVGYDDIYMSAIVTPELTTVRQPAYQMGYKAAEMAVKLIDNKKITKDDYLLNTELVVRSSTK